MQSSSSDDGMDVSRSPTEVEDPSRGDDQVPGSSFVTRRGRRVRKGRQRRSPWVSFPKRKKQKVKGLPSSSIISVQDPAVGRLIYDPLAPVSQSMLEEFHEWMRTGEPRYLDVGPVEADLSFFQGILGENAWLEDQVFNLPLLIDIYVCAYNSYILCLCT
jgi:hypothetical protein